MAKYAPQISGYANASKGEYIAESFVAYAKGERDLLDPQFVRYLDKNVAKSVAKSAESGIMKLPKQDKLNIPIRKFTEYALNPQKSPDKAIAFEKSVRLYFDRCRRIDRKYS